MRLRLPLPCLLLLTLIGCASTPADDAPPLADLPPDAPAPDLGEAPDQPGEDVAGDLTDDASVEADQSADVPADVPGDTPTDAPADAPEPLEITWTTPTFNTGGVVTQFAADLPCGPHPENAFDIAVPQRGALAPLVIFIHGGGFVQGDKSSYWTNAAADAGEVAALLGAGIAVASINYRLLQPRDPDGVIKPLRDAARCVQYLRYHAATSFNADPTKLGLMGGSAGAGTALWLAFHDDLADPQASDPVARVSTVPTAVAVTETQATYDVLRWEQDVFSEYFPPGQPGFIEAAVALGLEQRLLSFYGINQPAQLMSPAIVRYRQEVDMLGLMDADDIGFWVANIGQRDVPPTTVGLLYHHGFHARALSQRAQEVGIEAEATWGHRVAPARSRAQYIIDKLVP